MRIVGRKSLSAAPYFARASVRTLAAAALFVLPFFAISPASAQQCNSYPQVWYQPSTVEKGNSILVAANGISGAKRVEYTFVHTTALYHFRYTTKKAQSNCVVNQEYINTALLKKGEYVVHARIIGSFPEIHFSLQNLNIVAPSTAIPLPPPVNCGQTTHVWYGPSNNVSSSAVIYIAGVIKPNTQLTYYFDKVGALIDPTTTGSVVTGTSTSCVTPPANIGTFPAGTYNVYAGFVDEYGRYNYSLQGQLTVF
jgi:hypothetical protein